MEQKRSTGISISGWSNVIIGIIGIMCFLRSIFLFVEGAMNMNAPDSDKGAFVSYELGQVGIWYSIPYISMLILGIGIIKLNSLARKVYVMYLLPLAIAISFIWIDGSHESFFLPLLIPQIAFICIQIFYLTRPKVKEQFK